jgi:hypothetical protein
LELLALSYCVWFKLRDEERRRGGGVAVALILKSDSLLPNDSIRFNSIQFNSIDTVNNEKKQSVVRKSKSSIATVYCLNEAKLKINSAFYCLSPNRIESKSIEINRNIC